MSKPLLRLSLALSVASVPATAQVSSDYEWEFSREGDACFLGTYSYTGNSRMQLHHEGGQVAAFIVVSSDLVGQLADEAMIQAKGMFSNGETIELGTLFVAGKAPLKRGDPTPWTYLMFTDPTVAGVSGMFINNSLTIYAEGDYLGTFPLENLNTLIMPFSDCQ